MRLAEAEFDVFLTADRNLPHQQSLGPLSLGIVVLAAGTTKLDGLRLLAHSIQKAVDVNKNGQIIHAFSA